MRYASQFHAILRRSKRRGSMQNRESPFKRWKGIQDTSRCVNSVQIDMDTSLAREGYLSSGLEDGTSVFYPLHFPTLKPAKKFWNSQQKGQFVNDWKPGGSVFHIIDIVQVSQETSIMRRTAMGKIVIYKKCDYCAINCKYCNPQNNRLSIPQDTTPNLP